MLKNIQKYLLLNHPLLWNIRIVPILLGIVVFNILFFCIGYFNTQVSFDFFGGNSSVLSSELVYFGAVVLAILCFIYWMMQYSKNNAFKVFYPKTAASLFLEWLFVFVIISGFALFPYSFYRGENVKVKSYMKESEALEAAKILKMADILIPYSKRAYLDEKADSSELVLFSLLNYTGSPNIYIPSEYDLETSGYETVKSWLEAQDKEKINRLMDAFLRLQEKHNLPTNLTKEKWMEIIYNPPVYPVGNFNLIKRNGPDYVGIKSYGYDRYMYYDDNDTAFYYLPYRELARAHQDILEAHIDTGLNQTLMVALWIIYVALFLSMNVISFRVTSGKKWLITLLTLGVFSIISHLFAQIVGVFWDDITIILNILIYIAAFCYGLGYVTVECGKVRTKGRYSAIWINLLLWFIPVILMLLYWFVYMIGDEYGPQRSENVINSFLYKHSLILLWLNVCFTFVSMWFFSRLLLQWKSLPEE